MKPILLAVALMSLTARAQTATIAISLDADAGVQVSEFLSMKPTVAVVVLLALTANAPVPSPLLDATPTQRGLMSTSTQSIGGVKTFVDGVQTDLRAGSSIQGRPLCTTAPLPGQVLAYTGQSICWVSSVLDAGISTPDAGSSPPDAGGAGAHCPGQVDCAGDGLCCANSVSECGAANCGHCAPGYVDCGAAGSGSPPLSGCCAPNLNACNYTHCVVPGYCIPPLFNCAVLGTPACAADCTQCPGIDPGLCP